MNVKATGPRSIGKTKTRISYPRLRKVSHLCAGCALLTSTVWAAATYTVTSASKYSQGVNLKLSKGAMRVEVCTPTIIHVLVSPSDSIPDQLVPVVIHHWTPVPFKYRETPSTLFIDTGQTEVKITRNTGAVAFLNPSGRILLSEASDGGRAMQPANIMGQREWKIGQTFLASDDEALYGLGQHQEGWLDVKGIPVRLQQANTDIGIPFLLSTKGYGLLWNNPSLTDFDPAEEEIPIDPKTGEGTFQTGKAGIYGFLIVSDLRSQLKLEVNNIPVVDLHNMWVPYSAGGKAQLPAQSMCKVNAAGGPSGVHVFVRRPSATTEFASAAGRAIDYYFFYGPNLNRVVAEYREATGPAPLFPRWAYGFWQCRERYSSQQQILQVASEFRARRIPVDVMVQDWQYWGKYGWNAMRFDENYPQPAEMITKLHSEQVHFALSVWSKFGEETEIYKQMAARSFLIPGTPWVDIFNPAAEQLFWSTMKNNLFDKGVDAWWLDATEPEGDPLEGKETYLGPGNTVLNAYPLYVTQTVYDGQRSANEQKRVVILTRSAFAGQQRNAAASWSGDITGSWDSLRRQIPGGLSFAMSGVPYWTTDIGGFFRPRDQYTSNAYHELLIRWFEFGAFCPVFRIHGYKTQTEMWKFGADTEKVLLQYDDLRYRLLPYIYSSAWQVTHSGGNLMRALPLDFGDDRRVFEIPDQFMFGPSILVNPVVKPDVDSRPVYLPKATAWIDFWTGQQSAGGQQVNASAPLDRMPLYVRAGSILPLARVKQDAMQPDNDIELRIYRGANGSFNLYEDQGDGYGYEKGDFSVIPIEWNESSRTLAVGKRAGAFKGMQSTKRFHIVWVRPNKGVGPEITAAPDSDLTYRGSAVSVHAPGGF